MPIQFEEEEETIGPKHYKKDTQNKKNNDMQKP